MKKLICALLVTMLILGVSVVATATSEPTESVSPPVTTEPNTGTVTCIANSNTLPGQTLTVTVAISNCESAWAVEYTPVFDSNVFELTDVAFQITPTQQMGNAIFFDGNVDINCNLITLTLRALDNAQPGQYKIGCAVTAYVGTSQNPLTLTSATAEVECPHSYIQNPEIEGTLASPATCTQPAMYYQTCSVCGLVDTTQEVFPFGETLPHTFDAQVIAPEYLKDSGNCSSLQVYCLSCSVCGLRSPNEDTDIFQPDGYFGDHVYDNDCDTRCNFCGRFQEAKHIAGTEWFSNGEEHWHKCITCLTNMDHQKHQAGPMSAGDRTQVCAICEYVMDDGEEDHICSYGDQWHSNDGNHWRACECGKTASMGIHQWDAGATITTPTADKEGLMIYTCTICQHERQQVLPATGNPTEPTDYPSLPTVPVQQVVIEKDGGPNIPAILLGILLAISLIANGILVYLLYQITHRRPQRRRRV